MCKYDNMNLSKSFSLKEGLDPEMILYMHPNLLTILVFVVNFCYQNNVDCVVTSGIRTHAQNVSAKSKSRTHEEGRAFDLRTRNIPQNLIFDLTESAEIEFGNIGAISYKTHKSRPVVYGDENHLDHIHFQVRP